MQKAYADYAITFESLGIKVKPEYTNDKLILLGLGAFSALVKMAQEDKLELGYFHIFENEQDDEGEGRHWEKDLDFETLGISYNKGQPCLLLRVTTKTADVEEQNIMTPPLLECLTTLDMQGTDLKGDALEFGRIGNPQ